MRASAKPAAPHRSCGEVAMMTSGRRMRQGPIAAAEAMNDA
jgi:hypothetical protein